MSKEIIVFEPQPIEGWDYNDSVKKVRGYFLKWGTLTQDILNELATARETLSKRYHRDGTNVPSWDSYCQDIGLEKRTVNRWLERHLRPELPHVSRATGENEWYTPHDIVESARMVMGEIDCDPASSDKANETIKAKTFYTIKENGLEQSWSGNVWMNPPYAQPLVAEFSEAVSSKYESGEIKSACILVNNATETAWFQRMLSICSAVCFLTGRVKFIDEQGEASGAPLQGQAVIYLGKNVGGFHSAFSGQGIVLDGPGKDTE
jgi:ParB family chromosome partitioning protein